MFNFSDDKKQVVGFSLTPGIGLEAVVLDKTKTSVINYGRKKVDYNFSQRNVQNYAQFKNAVLDLVDELRISPKSYAYVTLPNVYFDFIELADDTPDSGIEMALTSTAEEFYIFKKEEPMVGWSEVANLMNPNQKKYAYSAFQRNDIDQIKEIFAEADLELIGVETNYSTTLRGLNLTGLINDVVLMNSTWSLLLINTNSFTLFHLEGKNLLEYSEVPLAIKSFSTEEAYQAIISSISQLVTGATTQLYLVSQTDDISAEALKKIMQFDREVIAIDSNKFSKKPLMDVTQALDQGEANSLTLSALGAADIKSDFDLKINTLSGDANIFLGVYFTLNIGGTPVEITGSLIKKYSLIVAIVLGVILGSIYGIMFAFNTQKTAELTKVRKELNQVNKKIEDAKKEEKQEVVEEVVEVDMTDIIDEIAEENVSTMKFYDSISSDIPKNVWLTKYYNNNGSSIAVSGVAESIPDIYEYYKNLRIVAPQSDVKLTELKVVTGDTNSSDEELSRMMGGLAIDKDVDRLYSFVISNTEFNTEVGAQVSDESDVLARPQAAPTQVENTSGQMTPVSR